MRVCRSLLLPGALVFAVSSCTVGPDFDRPEVQAPASWAADDLGAGERVLQESPQRQWWLTFEDAELTRLMDEALRRNSDLAVAKQRLREARALIGVVESRLLPDLASGGQYRRIGLSENLPVLDDFIDRGRIDRDQELFAGSFDASWEIDLFGGSRRAVEAARAGADAAAEELRGVRVSLLAEVARNYFTLRGEQARVRALRDLVGNEERALELADEAQKSGLGAGVRTQRGEARVSEAAARLPQAQAAVAASVIRLAVLIDRPVEDVWDALREPRSLPAAPDAVPVGLPGDLLRRRPDVRAAERRLHRATAEVGVAVADLYPKFHLTGDAGLAAGSFGSLFNAGSFAWSVGPSIRWPVFRGGEIRANIEAFEARLESAKIRYHQSVREAIGDAETALTRYGRAFQAREALREAAVARRREVELAKSAFASGLAPRSEIVSARRRLIASRLAENEAEVAVLTALASLHKALGGGWQTSAPDSGRPSEDRASSNGADPTSQPLNREPGSARSTTAAPAAE